MPNKDRSFHEAPETAGGDAALRLDHRGNIKKRTDIQFLNLSSSAFIAVKPSSNWE